MGPARRAYDLLRGYVNNEWERIQGVDRKYAERELSEAMDNPATLRRPDPQSYDSPSTGSHVPAVNAVDRTERARQILGVAQNADFDAIRHAFEKLNRRSDPNNFAEGSEARANAAEIQKRVQWAYGVLTEGMDVTEKRFRSLEID
jgi:hypothetical protein